MKMNLIKNKLKNEDSFKREIYLRNLTQRLISIFRKLTIE